MKCCSNNPPSPSAIIITAVTGQYVWSLPHHWHGLPSSSSSWSVRSAAVPDSAVVVEEIMDVNSIAIMATGG